MLKDEKVMVLNMEKFGMDSYVQTTEDSFFGAMARMKEMLATDAEEISRYGQTLLDELIPEDRFFDDHHIEVFHRTQRWIDHCDKCVELVCADYVQEKTPIAVVDYYTLERGVICLH